VVHVEKIRVADFLELFQENGSEIDFARLSKWLKEFWADKDYKIDQIVSAVRYY
jgi:hypothetical protein